MVFYHSSAFQPGNAGPRFSNFKVSGQLSQPREDATSRAPAHSWDRPTRKSQPPWWLWGQGSAAQPQGAAAAKGNLGCEAAAHVWSPEEITRLTSRKLPYKEQPVVKPSVQHTGAALKRRTGMGATQNTADEELLLPDPAPRLDTGHSIP